MYFAKIRQKLMCSVEIRQTVIASAGTATAQYGCQKLMYSANIRQKLMCSAEIRQKLICSAKIRQKVFRTAKNS
jgi:hypothetical protein